MLIYFITTHMLLSVLFARTFGGTEYDVAHSTIQPSDGGYAVAGWTNGYGAGDNDCLVLKLTSSGTLEWAKTFGGSNLDEALSIIHTSDGGYAVAGYTESFGAGGYDCFVLKLTSSGTLEWAKTFGGTDDDYAESIVQTSDGGYVVGGGTYSFGVGEDDCLVLKLTSSGTLQWARTFGGDTSDYAYSVIQTSDGGYAVAGRTDGFGADSGDCLILKLTSSGTVEWARTYGGKSNDWAEFIIQTSDGGYAVAGGTHSFGAGEDDLLILKLTSTGTLEWAKTFGGTDDDYAWSIIRTSDEGYAIAGWTESFGAGNDDCLVLKLTSTGTLEWAKTFGGTEDDYSESIVQTADGGYAIAGEIWSYGAGYGDFLILKLGSDGSYPGCVADCSLSVGTPTLSSSSPTLSTSSPSVGADCSPTVRTPTLTITDACPPAVEESGVSSGRGINYSPVSGGILFNSPSELSIKIYSVDGRVAYSGQLQKGENRITLGQGVYLWIAGPYRGKAAVR